MGIGTAGSRAQHVQRRGIDDRQRVVTLVDDEPGEITIVATNPEPASMVVWSVLGAAGFGLSYFRRRKVAA